MKFLFFLCLSLRLLTFADTGEMFSMSLFEWVNHYRAEKRLGVLIWDAKLAALAFEHSSEMNENQSLSHEGFDSRFESTLKKVCVENVGVGFLAAEDQGKAWEKSPRHNANLLKKKIKHCAVSKVGKYVTFLATD